MPHSVRYGLVRYQYDGGYTSSLVSIYRAIEEVVSQYQEASPTTHAPVGVNALSITAPATTKMMPRICQRLRESCQTSTPITTTPAVPRPAQIAYATPIGICLRTCE